MDSDFLTRLHARRAGLEQLEPGWRMIDDVLSGRIKRRGADGWSSPYFPKGRLEPLGEYSLRVELTPFFPQTPQLLASRMGALFKTRLQLELFSKDEHADWHGRVEQFHQHAGRRQSSFEDVAVQASCLAQSHGFCAALLDRDPLPVAMSERDVSVAEAHALNLGRPYIALYAAPDILDWEFSSDGRLAWVKFCEQESQRATWDADPQPIRTIRVVDREAITVYRVWKDASGQWQVQTQSPLKHGFVNEVPVVFLHPFPGNDGIGRPVLQRAAEADIAAARVLSDLVWDLFLLGNPILTLKTNRSDDELRRLHLGASRYIPLRNGQPGMENAEELAFVQLDPTGIELLFKAHSLFAANAMKQAGAGMGEDAAIPTEQTGIAQAWRFKTGEERVLFMLARALEPFLTSCIKLATKALAPSETFDASALNAIAVRMPDSFDVASSQETLASAEKIIDLATKLGQTELAKSALQKIESLLGALPPDRRQALAAERSALSLNGGTAASA